MPTTMKLLVLVGALSSLQLAATFMTPQQVARPVHSGPIAGQFCRHSTVPIASSALYRPPTCLQAGANADIDGAGRGLVILGIVVAICVWIFSIPPEFRRAHICTTDECVASRASCYDCVTLQEWTDDIGNYYRNGGGIQFDFTVAEETKQLWSGQKK